MNKPVIVVGMGEMAGVFTRGLLRCGYPVYPVTRQTDLNAVVKAVADPSLVLVAVGEADLHATLKQLPQAWLLHLGLLQNELLPRDWNQHHISHPTIISVWFEKKKGQDFKVLVPSPIYGPQSAMLKDALMSLDIPCWELKTEAQLEFELVRKNVYILTTNITGLETGGSVKDMWNKHQALACEVANDVIDIQAWLTGHTHDRKKLIEGMVEAIHGDPEHKCMGRSAPARLQRAIEQADAAKLDVPKLRELANKHL
ncbi:MAG: hypothetical protein OEY89_14640 [Gammaproteobacteria bacterium]|nr:hypothetical protein [Gammaproteobacteria bacterium]